MRGMVRRKGRVEHDLSRKSSECSAVVSRASAGMRAEGAGLADHGEVAGVQVEGIDLGETLQSEYVSHVGAPFLRD